MLIVYKNQRNHTSMLTNRLMLQYQYLSEEESIFWTWCCNNNRFNLQYKNLRLFFHSKTPCAMRKNMKSHLLYTAMGRLKEGGVYVIFVL